MSLVFGIFSRGHTASDMGKPLETSVLTLICCPKLLWIFASSLCILHNIKQNLVQMLCFLKYTYLRHAKISDQQHACLYEHITQYSHVLQPYCKQEITQLTLLVEFIQPSVMSFHIQCRNCLIVLHMRHWHFPSAATFFSLNLFVRWGHLSCWTKCTSIWPKLLGMGWLVLAVLAFIHPLLYHS
jgi:hypothetical protein